MVVDRVCVVRSQNASECVNQDVLFLGTSELTIAIFLAWYLKFLPASCALHTYLAAKLAVRLLHLFVCVPISVSPKADKKGYLQFPLIVV